MNITDLRISYKISTGRYPLYFKERVFFKYTFVEGTPINEYGIWLEDRFNFLEIKKIRNNFYFQTLIKPTNLFYAQVSKYEKYSKEYILWLEEYILNNSK
jgi:hypothetical protein